MHQFRLRACNKTNCRLRRSSLAKRDRRLIGSVKLDLPFGLRRRGAVCFVARPRRSAPQDRLGLASRIRSRPIPGNKLPGGPPLGARNATRQLIVFQALTAAVSALILLALP